MSKKPSDTTRLRQVLAEVREVRRELNTVRIELAHYRGRASKSEAETADWKRRFDLLLTRTPPVPTPAPPLAGGVDSSGQPSGEGR
jgi:hypothetical protein